MKFGYVICILIYSVICGVVFTNESEEIVLLHDLNSDHHRRNLDAGLSPYLEFIVKRISGDVKLTLSENKRLNPNAPSYEIKAEKGGKRSLIKTKSRHLEERFYHDKGKGGAFSVRCELAAHGPCQRMLTGSFYLGGKHYEITPASDKYPKRNSDDNMYPMGTVHYMKEIEVPDRSFNRSLGPDQVPPALDVIEPKESDVLFREMDILGKMSESTATLNDVEIFVVVDSFLYKRFYDDAAATETLTREEVTELNIRRHYSLVVNGVSLRYETIEDPELKIFCTVSGFLIVKERDENFNLPEEVEVGERYVYTHAGSYLGSVRDLFWSVTDLPDTDHIMVFTGCDITSTDDNGETTYGVAGMAYLKAACTGSKVSLNEAFGSFFTTSLIASHELGHNLGSSHDGEGTSTDCLKANQYIMSYLAHFYDESLYNINPWRFSRCSIEAMKKYINGLGSNNCLVDQGDVYDQEEYDQHLSMLPGERHDVDGQCRLIQGKDSKLCESTDLSNLCLVMKCIAPSGDCKRYTAARGTTCGENKWCIDGACISKVPVPEDNSCIDKGYGDYSCSDLRRIYITMADYCHTWSASCCKTCKKHMGCWDGVNSAEYSGYVSWTKNGRTCQHWSSQTPHKHTRNTDDRFPKDSSVADAENYCRDPDGEGKTWCYTTNEDVRWEYCDIPICNVDCYQKSDPKQYKGKVSKPSSITQCQAWSEQTPHTHKYNKPEMFPADESVLAANNYCRDPSDDGRPWCYTVNSNVRWDWCPVPSC